MQFINIVVHSVEDMNFRVHLQYEFTKLGLEEFLQVSCLSLWKVYSIKKLECGPREIWSLPVFFGLRLGLFCQCLSSL